MKIRKKVIKKKKKTWSRLSKTEQRITLTKDVLEQIRLKSFNPTLGTYISVDENDYEANEYSCQLNALIKDKKVTCQACAKGGLFIAHVMRNNHLTLGEVSNSNTEMLNRLGGIFSKQQLDLIEAALKEI